MYTRIGSFAVDANNTMVDPSTGYKLQRMGSSGESEGFQTLGDSSIHIPWDSSMPAQSTSQIILNGNLSSSNGTPETNKLVANMAFTTTTASGEQVAMASTVISDLDQWVGAPLGATDTGTLLVSGIKEDGTVFTNAEVDFTGADTMQTILTKISNLYDDSTATLNADGKIVITGTPGYSLAQVTGMTYEPAGSEDLTIPTYFDYSAIGGDDTRTFKISIYDDMGQQHVLTGTFVKTDTNNTWDLVIQSIDDERAASWSSYDILNSTALNRRISGIEFNTDGSFKGLNSTSEFASFSVQFASNPSVTQTITLDLGTAGEFTGLTQFASQQSSAAALSQDGYEAGSLSSVTIDNTGMIVGTFTNGVKVNIATLQIGVFQNSSGLESAGNGYFMPTANSGESIATTAGSGGAGSITGKSLEKSNVDIATEFVNLMQAQNGYQANSRTIRVANDVLQELTNLIR
ncbi:MAG: flagellar hook-basal body complex protein [Chloroflexi bacterium]|nr:flagellar hook-basal body complex protein [Chloroflexota bacterium]